MQMDSVEDGIAYLLLFVNPICCDVTRLSFYIQNDALDFNVFDIMHMETLQKKNKTLFVILKVYFI